MAKYICSICGYVYDEKNGETWQDVPDDYVCPLCGATKENFKKDEPVQEVQKITETIEIPDDLKQMNALEMSVLCSNLARGCEKQYLAQEQEQFSVLADYFKSAAPKEENKTIQDLLELINQDLQELIPYANQTATKHKDRGAMRALVWGEKVTLILNSILQRYQKLGDAMLENTGVYVCTICGFIHIGDAPPQLCPVCKVPSYKFEKIERSA